MRTNRGFSLLELAIVLVVLSIITTVTMRVLGSLRGVRERIETKERLTTVAQALQTFVIRTGRLPCPSNPSLPLSDANSGVEQPVGGGCSAANNTGAVPWHTLGLLSDQTLDGWGNRITYKVSPSAATAYALYAGDCVGALLGANAPLTATHVCAPRSETSCSSANISQCTPLDTYRSYLSATSVQRDDAGAISSVAYALVSHGESAGGAHSAQGVVQEAPAGDTGTNEATNAGPGQIVMIRPYSEAEGPGHFDDMVVAEDFASLIQKAGLGPLPLH